jgi:hypothetical protein
MKKRTHPKTAEEFLAQDPAERFEETSRLLAERIAHHDRKVAARKERDERRAG